MNYIANKKADGRIFSIYENEEKKDALTASTEGDRKAENGIRRSARLQVVLPEPSVERLEKLKETTEAASFAEVIRISLRLYEGLLNEAKNGGKICVERPDGTKEYILLFS